MTGVVGNIQTIRPYAIRSITEENSNNFSNSAAELWAVNQLSGSFLVDLVPSAASFPPNPYPAKVLNQSCGSSRFGDDGQPIMDMSAWVNNIFIPTCQQLAGQVNQLVNATGAVQVMAAGNDGHGLINDADSGCPNIHAVVVEATGPNGDLAYYSTYYDAGAMAEYTQYQDVLMAELGSVYPQSIIVKAPGGNATQANPEGMIYSTMNCPSSAGSVSPTPDQNLDCYGYMQGTSMAAPHVSGMVVLIYMLEPNANYDYVSKILGMSADRKGILSARLVVQNTMANPLEQGGGSSNSNTVPIILGAAGGLAVLVAILAYVLDDSSATQNVATENISS